LAEARWDAGKKVTSAREVVCSSGIGKIDEDWSDLRNDARDATGNSSYQARWLCNYPFNQTDQTAFELP